jgi:hypothetical protein
MDGNVIPRALVLQKVHLPEYPGDVLFDDRAGDLPDDHQVDLEGLGGKLDLALKLQKMPAGLKFKPKGLNKGRMPGDTAKGMRGSHRASLNGDIRGFRIVYHTLIGARSRTALEFS